MYKSEFGLEKYFTILPPDLMFISFNIYRERSRVSKNAELHDNIIIDITTVM
jgi:hypothetical protein